MLEYDGNELGYVEYQHYDRLSDFRHTDTLNSQTSHEYSQKVSVASQLHLDFMLTLRYV